MENKNTYEVIETSYGKVIQMTSPEGIVSNVPADPTNKDYAAYLEFLNDDTETE